MIGKTISLFPLIVASILLPAFFSAGTFAEDIRYCEPISDADGNWRYPDENAYFNELTLQAERLAVQHLFEEELADFQSSVLTQDMITEALRYYIEYESDTGRGENKRDFCAILKKARRKDGAATLFSPIQVGQICHFDFERMEERIEEMKKTFIADLRSKESLSNSVLSMMQNPDNINMKTDAQLRRFVYEKDIDPDSNAVAEVGCKALYVYPVELYAASSKRKLSSVISVLPEIEILDEKKKKGEFQLVVIEKDYHWIKGSSEKIANVGNIEKFTTPFLNENFQNYVNTNFRDIVCIGMASCEGDLKIENTRGKRRSEKLKLRLQEAFGENSDLNIFALNLGKHKFTREECKELSDEASNSQRIVMLVGVTKRTDPSVKLEETLDKAMERMANSQKDLLPINPNDYHLFELFQ